MTKAGMMGEERDLSLVISRLEDFAAKVTSGLDSRERIEMQEIIRTLVRRIEIDEAGMEIVFRVPPPSSPSRPGTSRLENASWQHRTTVYRTYLRKAHSGNQRRG